MAGAGSETAPAFVVGGGRGMLEYVEHCSCIECLISAAEVCQRINGVVGPGLRLDSQAQSGVDRGCCMHEQPLTPSQRP